MSEPSRPAPVGKPGRYERNVGGLVGSMIVLVLAVVAFVVFRDFFRAEPESVAPVEEVDYLSAVRAGQESGFPVLYPAELPDGWQATSARLPFGDEPEWTLGMLVDGERFAGVKVTLADQEAVLDTVLGEDREADGSVEVSSSTTAVAGGWGVWTEGSDTALVRALPAAEAEAPAVAVVYGSLDEDELVDLAGSLTDAPLSRG
ncbi:DUF4245 family protein [Nocardioides sp. ChNu-153]|uniref:DUF4245 family protein n=1 Tax=unclassified Nocardioides TaxID=2615069 RepID=UPI002405C6A1|nr:MULTISPECIES: DUF4245 family protein [unclassified Nocardioides]MDF9716969.1 DUF4245 domain-containing protein [Nocardioides sp. ChNu-99]MDN7121388.1 DUF4245 family protein [Nocardioides sp. ChNu-153]